MENLRHVPIVDDDQQLLGLVSQHDVICAMHSFFDGSLDQAQQLRRPPMAWSPLAGGKLFTEQSEHAERLRACLDRLAEQYQAQVDQLAFAWLLHHPAQILPVIGSQSLERIALASKSAHIALTDNDWYDIWEAGGSHLP